MSDLMLDVDQAGELKAAFRRGNWNNTEIKKLCEGDVLAQVRDVLRGISEIKMKELIVLTAKVNRTRSQQEAIEATGRTQYTDSKVVDSMPKGEGDEVEVVFFKPDFSQRNGYISDDDLEKEFDLRGLKPADPISVAAVNEADPAFADDKPHGTHWKDVNGNWCYATFSRWDDERLVNVRRYDLDWSDFWWFVGVRK